MTILSDDHFTINEHKVRATIQAKYTHGKPLRGTVVVSISDRENPGCFIYREHRSDDDEMCIRKTIPIDGQGSVEFDIQNELKFDRSENNKYFDWKNFTLQAEVTETLTGLSQSAEKSIKIHKNTYNITTDLSTMYRLNRDSSVDMTVSFGFQAISDSMNYC